MSDAEAAQMEAWVDEIVASGGKKIPPLPPPPRSV